MPDSLEELVMLQPPTPERPLLGSIVLVVEDGPAGVAAVEDVVADVAGGGAGGAGHAADVTPWLRPGQ